MPATGTYLQHASLVEALPPLVRKQRRLALTIAAVAMDVVEEKAVRGQIDQLLVAAKVDLVTCNGYDVKHNVRAGQTSVNTEKLVAALVVAGLEEAPARVLVRACEETGEPAKFATVTPSKGAKVRV